MRLRQWWRPDARPTVWYSDPSAYVNHSRELLDRAVAANLRASGPLSTTLSGGLDSGLVTATAARQLRESGHTLTAYTARPTPGISYDRREGWEADDGPYHVSRGCHV